MDNSYSRSKNFMNIPFANPQAQFNSYRDEIEKSILNVVRGNKYILGDQLQLLEDEFASFIGTKYSIGVANGTDAIEISLKALNIGTGDEVITVSHTAVATVAAIEAANATPILIDINEEDYILDPNLISNSITSKTKAIILVHLYGQSGNIELIKKICESNNIYLIEDASQAHGAFFGEKRLGNHGIIGTFSCYPTKNLGAIGDAGLITTNDEEIAKNIRKIREYGWEERYISSIKGRNSRLDEIQAAILRIKLKNLDKDNNKRKKIANLYNQELNGDFSKPFILPNRDHVYHLYVIRTKLRDELKSFLINQGIYTGIHYPVPIHLQKAYEKKINLGSKLNITEKVSKEIISLPIYPEIPISDVKKVIKFVNKFFKCR